MKNNKDIDSLSHTTWRCQYHVVFAPKYRRMVIYGHILPISSFIKEMETYPCKSSLVCVNTKKRRLWKLSCRFKMGARICLLYDGFFLLPSSGRSFHIYETWCLANTRREIPAPTPHDEADWAVNFQFKQNKAWNFLINREISGFLFAMISSNFYTIRQFYAKRCYDLCRAKRVLFRFGSRNGCVVGGCRPAKGCIRKWVHGFLNR